MKKSTKEIIDDLCGGKKISIKKIYKHSVSIFGEEKAKEILKKTSQQMIESGDHSEEEIKTIKQTTEQLLEMEIKL